MLRLQPSDPNSPMDSLHDPLFSATTYLHTLRRRSTSQMCLHRILSVIATVPPPPLPAAKPSLLASEIENPVPEGGAVFVDKGCGFDLNSPEVNESPSSSSIAGEGSDVDREDGGDREERSLTLLIEAAKLIFGEFMDGEKSELNNTDVAVDIEPIGGEIGPPRSRWSAAEVGGEFEESPPSSIARSKRERTRVLPCRYRDSVLEPLTRFSRAGSSILPAKRRRR